MVRTRLERIMEQTDAPRNAAQRPLQPAAHAIERTRPRLRRVESTLSGLVFAPPRPQRRIPVSPLAANSATYPSTGPNEARDPALQGERPIDTDAPMDATDRERQ